MERLEEWLERLGPERAGAVLSALGAFGRLYVEHVEETGSLPGISFEPGESADPFMRTSPLNVAEAMAPALSRATPPDVPAISAAHRAELMKAAPECAWVEKLEVSEVNALLPSVDTFLERFPSWRLHDGYGWPRFDSSPERDTGLRAAVHRMVLARRVPPR